MMFKATDHFDEIVTQFYFPKIGKNWRISLNYSEGKNVVISEEYHILESNASSNRRLVIKSNKSGNISLGRKWKDCGAWIQLEDKLAT